MGTYKGNNGVRGRKGILLGWNLDQRLHL